MNQNIYKLSEQYEKNYVVAPGLTKSQGWYLVIFVDFSPFRRSQEYEQLFLHEQSLLHQVIDTDQKKMLFISLKPFNMQRVKTLPRPGDGSKY